ncbi:hypothetical protein [Pseudarthrobacter sp. S9]|uniref:hypothetical protein n=1 Tax=Pseudarthrobacter sp. S9 TaxID=3418421 RepID=UPI003CFFA6D5
MNPLVASVIRTVVPVVVGQVTSWLLLANVTLPGSAADGLSTFLGGLFTAIYYVGVRVLEQQWPQAGVLLGLTASPDTYSKGEPAPASAPAPATATASVNSPAPATIFPAAAVEAAVAAHEPVSVTPEPVAPIYEAPAVPAEPVPVAP